MDPDQANDKYRATLRGTYIADPADSSLAVTAIPANLPTLVTVGWNTQYETVFRVTGTSGDNSSNYALTGLTVIKGAGLTTNLPEGSAVNCLNHEEYFNQYASLIATIQQTADDLQAIVDSGLLPPRIASTASSATPTPNADTTDQYQLTALAAAAEFQTPSGTPIAGQKLIIRIKDNSTVRALTWVAIYRALGTELPSTTVDDKTLYLGFIYNLTDTKWDLVASAQES